ncbi:MAG: helix-turn-helix transcriptional regulator [Verrucomicrobiota bacterium]|jgi:PTS system nitrogen regulatory IIA component
MATQEPTGAPEPFVRLLRKAVAQSGLSLRDIGRRIGVSTAYMSRLVNKQRGLPDDDAMLIKLEDVLDIQPRGLLFDAAGRHDVVASKVLKRDGARILMRTLAKLTDEDMAQIQKRADELAKKYHPQG